MSKRSWQILALATLAPCHVIPALAEQPPIPLIRQIPVPYLQDVAMASFDAFGPVIYYNPNIVAMSSPLLNKFFLLHETGHHVLNHIQQRMFMYDPYSRASSQEMEKQADCYAARFLALPEQQAVAQWFSMMQGPMRPDWLHPTGYERAQVLLSVNEVTQGERDAQNFFAQRSTGWHWDAGNDVARTGTGVL